MSDFYKAIINLPVIVAGLDCTSVEYAHGHRDALVAASKIALDADVRVNRLETDLAAANAEIAKLKTEVVEKSKMLDRLERVVESYKSICRDAF